MSGMRVSQDKSATFKLQERVRRQRQREREGVGRGGRLRGGGAMHLCKLLWEKRSAQPR